MRSYSGVLYCLLRLAHSDIFAAFDARKAALTCRSPMPLACGSALLGSQHGAQHGQHLRTRTSAEPTTDAGDVVLDGLRRDEELCADVPVGHAQ
jgi:hypothetical protein